MCKENSTMDKDWQNTLNTIPARLNHLLKDEKYCDCEFIINNDKKIGCHKIILAATSPVFEKMFYGSLSTDEDFTKPIIIEDCDYEIFANMISYVYSEQVTITNCEKACDLYQIAKKYMIQHLLDICVNYLGEHIDSNNFAEILNFAYFHSDVKLRKLCYRHIQVEPLKYLNSEALLNLHEIVFCEILELKKTDNLSSELILVKAVERWAISTAEKKGSDSIRGVCNSLVEKLNFTTISEDEFFSEVYKSKLLYDGEKLDLLARIVKPGLPPIESPLFQNKYKREQYTNMVPLKYIKESVKCNSYCDFTLIFTTNLQINLHSVSLGTPSNIKNGAMREAFEEHVKAQVVSLTNRNEPVAQGICKGAKGFKFCSRINFDKIVTLIPNTKYALEINYFTDEEYVTRILLDFENDEGLKINFISPRKQPNTLLYIQYSID